MGLGDLFHVAVCKGQQRNVPSSVTHVQSGYEGIFCDWTACHRHDTFFKMFPSAVAFLDSGKDEFVLYVKTY